MSVIIPAINGAIRNSVHGSSIFFDEYDVQWAMDLVRQRSTFTCAATARTCFGYVGDPSAANPPRLITNIPTDIDAIVGGRWISTVAEGAAVTDIFIDPPASLGTGWTDNGDGTYTCDGSQVGNSDINDTASGSLQYQGASTSFELISQTAGEVSILSGGQVGTSRNTVDTFIEEFTIGATGTKWGVRANALFVGTIRINYNRLVTPRFATDTTTGETLNPYTLKSTPQGTVKVFTAYATYAVATAYAAGVQVAILTTAGNRVYMQSSGGTSDAAAVVIADSDIGGAVVADNDINWTVLGYATGLAEQLEAASENELFPYDTPATQTTGSLGTGTWTLQVFGSGSALISAGTATINGEAACTEGSPNTINVTGAGTVTVTLTGALDYWQLEAGTVPTSLIPTVGTTLARAATSFMDTTAGRVGPNGEFALDMVCVSEIPPSLAYIFGSYIDADNFLGIRVQADQFTMIEETATVSDTIAEAFTIEAGKPFRVQAYMDGTNWGLRAFDIGDAEPAWSTAAKTSMPFASTFEFGARGNGGIPKSIDVISGQLTINKEDFGW